MCGIIFYFDRRRRLPVANLRASLALLAHRGPDNAAAFLVAGGQPRTAADFLRASGVPGDVYPEVAMLHTRLSIIDLSSASNQPMSTPDGRHVLIYNGEIYNYIELRDRLRARGIGLTTRGDTEVLLQLLVSEGPEGLAAANGMFAFALYDRSEETVLFGRDLYGEKPLFYSAESDRLVLASEIKALRSIAGNIRAADEQFLIDFITTGQWGCTDKTSTPFASIERLEPGEVLQYSCRTGALTPRWRESKKAYRAITTGYGENEVAALVEEAICWRLRSDAPVGIMVSGGVDSTSIAAVCAKRGPKTGLRFYTADTGMGNDLRFAREAATRMGIPLVEVPIRYEPQDAHFRQLTRQFDHPVPFHGIGVSGNAVYRRMQEDGVRVALEGTGGDEVFGGYRGFYYLPATSAVAARQWRLLPSYAIQALLASNASSLREKLKLLEFIAYKGTASWSTFQGREETTEDHLRRAALPAFRDRMQDQLTKQTMADALEGIAAAQFSFVDGPRLLNWLEVIDLNSMMFSVEARSPFLDKRLISLCDLPTRMKFRHGFNKYLLRNLGLGGLPDIIRWRTEKQGFKWDSRRYLLAHASDIVQQCRSSRILQKMLDVDDLTSEEKLKSSSILVPIVLRMYGVALWEQELGAELS